MNNFQEDIYFIKEYLMSDVKEIKNIDDGDIKGINKFLDYSVHDGEIYDHCHYEWIKIYQAEKIDILDNFEKFWISNINDSMCTDLSEDIGRIIKELNFVYKEYTDHIDKFIEPALPSIESCRSLLKYTSFLSDYNTKFYIDATTGNFGCTIKKKISKRRKKSIDLVFKSNTEILFCLTENMNNLIHIRGTADFDDDLQDAKAIRTLLNF